MVEVLNCDLLDAPADIIGGCHNCFCKFGKGLALAVKKKWPETYRSDLETKPGDIDKLGTIKFVDIEKPTNRIGKYCILYSQYRYGVDKQYTDYVALEKCLIELNGRIANRRLVLGLPYNLGCGWGGGDWKVVEGLINKVFYNSTLKVLICKKDN